MITHMTWRERVGRYRSELDAAQKPGAGVPAYTRWINRRGARLVAATAAASGLTPNHVTAISAALSITGMAVILATPPHALTGVVAACLFAAGYLFDSADGQLARLTHTSSATGEWVDHVVDAFRSPAIHLTTAVAITLYRPDSTWLAPVALAYALVTSGQFLSQILAESFIRRAGAKQTRGGTLMSFILIPTDPGTLCWTYLLWGWNTGFSIAYAALAALAIAHSAMSLGRRYRDLRALDAQRHGQDGA